MSEIKTQFGHEHRFIFLRQEKVCTKQWHAYKQEWTHYDVFFCEGCLAHQRVKVLVTTTNRWSLDGEVVTWRRV